MLNTYVLRGTFVGALGGLLFGFDTAVISGTTASLTHAFHLAPVNWHPFGMAHGMTLSEIGVTVSIALCGTVLGAVTAGSLGQRFGSREMLRLTALLYLLASVGCATAPNWGLLLCSRFLVGLGIGGSSVLGPVYIAELAPAYLRGRLVGTFQINIVLGILLAYFSNYCIVRLGLGASEWRWQLGIAAIPALAFFLMLFTIPQGARWLVSRHRMEEARQVLITIGSLHPESELSDIRDSMREDAHSRQARLFERHAGRFRYGVPILLAFAIGAFNQLSGINAILYYLNDIFAAAGFSKVSSNLQAVAIGTMNLIATLLGMALIDRIGRKRLLLIGAVGTAACLLGVALIFQSHTHQSLLVWALVLYIGFFAVSQGAVIWVYISEIFPTRVRGKGQSLGSGTHWVFNAILSYTFPVIALQSGAYPFFFFAAMMALQFVVVLLFFPETKQVSLEELQSQLKIA